MKRVLIVSNRLPIKVINDFGELTVKTSEGGLATGLASLNNSLKTEWIGWPGVAAANAEEQKKIEQKVPGEYHSVFMTKIEEKNYYQGFSNETIWPLFHCFTGSVNYKKKYWNTYKKINERFCDKVVEVAQEGDIIWVQDYHLMLLPELLKKKLPDNPVGFFLHIPFPSYEIFRTLPWRNEILNGLLHADLVGFHTYEYMRHFYSSVHRMLGYEANLGEIKIPGHSCFIDSFPMGINYEKFHNSSQDEAVNNQIQEFKKRFGDFRFILSVDRLDYTKGILQRLRAFKRLLERYPQLKEKVSLVMVTVPSRFNVDSYKELKENIDELVGQIDGKFSTLSWTPIHYFYRSVPFEYLTALYNLSDIGLVTPLRDGMNLVAKEYIASKKDKRGVLILSELAGAANELTDAISVNPNNEEDIVNALFKALNMPEEEQRERISRMQKVVKENSVEKWAHDFIHALNSIALKQNEQAKRRLNGYETRMIARAFAQAEKPLIILDYDGTLVTFNDDPQKAEPTSDLMVLLDDLCKKCEVMLVSGRDHNSLDRWFRNSEIGLIAEHGIWFKKENEWFKHADIDTSWKDEVKDLLNKFIKKTPGSFIENKTFSLAFHYRKTDSFLAEMQIPQIIKALTALCVKHRLELLQGNKVLEIRVAGINKGTAIQNILRKEKRDFILAIGDDSTDEDMFAVLPRHAFSIKVGEGETVARYRIENVAKVKQLLREIIKKKKARVNSSDLSGVLIH